MSKQIQWFPGHMAKTLRELNSLTKKIDVFFLLVDARAPKSSFIDSFNQLIKNKKVIVILTKSDLVAKEQLSYWINKYKKEYTDCIVLSLKNRNEVIKKIDSSLSQISIKSLLPKIMILGIPNVGKSTLLNVLLKHKKAKVENRPGVTMSTLWYQYNKKYWILDTPGLLQPKFVDETQGTILASIGSIKINILPIERVASNLSDILRKKNPNLIIPKLSSMDEYEKHKQVILNYQNNKYGKVVLD